MTMPLRPRLVVLNRLGLLEQVINQKNLQEHSESLINSPSTPPILRGYLNLLIKKKNIEEKYFKELQENPNIDAKGKEDLEQDVSNELNDLKSEFARFFDEYKNYEPIMTKVLQAHLYMHTTADKEGNWVLFAGKADADYAQRNALPLIEELKKEDLGIAYRMAAEIAVDETEKRPLLEKAAELGDVPAKGLIGYDYLSYLPSHAFDNKVYDYPAPDPSSHPRSSMVEALKEYDPDSVAKSLAYLDNVANALFELSNIAKRTAMASQQPEYELVLLPDDTPVTSIEKNKIYLSITNNGIKYTMDLSGETLTDEISSERLVHTLDKHRFEEQKSFLLPDLLKIISERAPSIQKSLALLHNQSIYDNNVVVMLGEAEKITTDRDLLAYIDEARNLIEQKKYNELSAVKAQIGARLTPYSEGQHEEVLDMIKKESKKELFIDPSLRQDLNKLYDHYQGEIDRIKSSYGSKPTQSDIRNITLLERAKEDLFSLNEEKDPAIAKQILRSHIGVTEGSIKKLPHPHAFLNFIENFINKYIPKAAEYKIPVKDKERVQILNNFASIKESLEILKNDGKKELHEKQDNLSTTLPP